MSHFNSGTNQLPIPSKGTYQNGNLERLIAQYQLHSPINLEKQRLTDHDMPTVVEQALIQRQCVELWLKHNTITSQGASILADAIRLSRTLKELYLYGNEISDEGSRSLAQAISVEHSTLARLSLGLNSITDEGARYLADMLKINRTLAHLLLSANSISDRGCLYLANVLINYNTTLERLDLDSNRAITDASLKTLTVLLKVNDNFIGLNLYDCTLGTSSKMQLKKIADGKAYFSLWV